MRCAQEKTEAKWCPCSPPILSCPSSTSTHRAIIGNKASNRTAVDFMLDKARLNPLHFYGMPSSNQGRMDLIQCNELVSKFNLALGYAPSEQCLTLKRDVVVFQRKDVG